MKDSIDGVLAQWQAVRPDLDVSPMSIIGRLSRLSRVIELSLQEVFAEHDLQRGEFDLLATLRRADSGAGLTAGELAANAMVTSGAITNRLDHLVAKGLVTRAVDPASRRAIRVALTPKGRRVLDAALVDHLANEERILASLSGPARSRLESLLRQLLGANEPD